MAKKGRITVATCQFTVGSNITSNGRRIREQIDRARRMRAEMAHFPESALSGYAGVDFTSWDDFDWDLATSEMITICRHALKRRIWVLVGSAHRLNGGNLPHNCTYLVAPDGTLADRYDKCFCTDRDLEFYTPGEHFGIFEINGVRCGMLVCFDARFPELYRQYKRRNVQVVLHSFYNARARKAGLLSEVMPATIRTRAASNYVWVSAANASGHYQEWPSFLARPDGTVAAGLTRHRPGVSVNTIDTSRSFYDAAGVYRNRAMKGLLNSAPSVRDNRSRDRKSL